MARAYQTKIQEADPGEVYLSCDIDGKTILGPCNLRAYINIMPLKIACIMIALIVLTR